MNTHTMQNAGLLKQTKQNVVKRIEASGIIGLQTLFATALKTELSRQNLATNETFHQALFN